MADPTSFCCLWIEICMYFLTKQNLLWCHIWHSILFLATSSFTFKLFCAFCFYAHTWHYNLYILNGMKTITQRLSEHFTFIACMFLSMNDILLPKMMYYCQKKWDIKTNSRSTYVMFLTNVWRMVLIEYLFSYYLLWFYIQLIYIACIWLYTYNHIHYVQKRKLIISGRQKLNAEKNECPALKQFHISITEWENF